jgi:hypothetical protein
MLFSYINYNLKNVPTKNAINAALPPTAITSKREDASPEPTIRHFIIPSMTSAKAVPKME